MGKVNTPNGKGVSASIGKKETPGWRCGSVVEYQPSICEALVHLQNWKKKKKKPLKPKLGKRHEQAHCRTVSQPGYYSHVEAQIKRNT
jgi:hypothetical protein